MSLEQREEEIHSDVWGLRSDYASEGHLSKEATKEFKILFIGVILQSHLKSHEKKSTHSIALTLNISSLDDETKS